MPHKDIEVRKVYFLKYFLGKKYNLTLKQFNELLDGAFYRCEICDSFLAFQDSKICVDHNHATKKVRGILCNNCNAGLGFFNDNPDRLGAAAKYLKRTSSGK